MVFKDLTICLCIDEVLFLFLFFVEANANPLIKFKARKGKKKNLYTELMLVIQDTEYNSTCTVQMQFCFRFYLMNCERTKFSNKKIVDDPSPHYLHSTFFLIKFLLKLQAKYCIFVQDCKQLLFKQRRWHQSCASTNLEEEKEAEYKIEMMLLQSQQSYLTR